METEQLSFLCQVIYKSGEKKKSRLFVLYKNHNLNMRCGCFWTRPLYLAWTTQSQKYRLSKY